MVEKPNKNKNRVELGAFAAELDLTAEQVTEEIAYGRLAADVDDTGTVYTDRFSVLDWINRRLMAISIFGSANVSFPLYQCDRDSIKDIKSQTANNVKIPHGFEKLNWQYKPCNN